jgi:hypothetical protein
MSAAAFIYEDLGGVETTLDSMRSIGMRQLADGSEDPLRDSERRGEWLPFRSPYTLLRRVARRGPMRRLGEARAVLLAWGGINLSLPLAQMQGDTQAREVWKRLQRDEITAWYRHLPNPNNPAEVVMETILTLASSQLLVDIGWQCARLAFPLAMGAQARTLELISGQELAESVAALQEVATAGWQGMPSHAPADLPFDPQGLEILAQQAVERVAD